MADKPKQKSAAQPAKKPVKPRGKASRQSEAELTKSTNAPAMRSKVDAAIADWQKNAPKEFRDVLEAE